MYELARRKGTGKREENAGNQLRYLCDESQCLIYLPFSLENVKELGFQLEAKRKRLSKTLSKQY